jgi:alanine dehydrogenase
MRIGIPTEVKIREGRVALVPPAAAELVRAGHEVYVQSGAGLPTGYTDEDYLGVGVKIAADAADLYGQAQLVVKVKEPIESEFGLLREDHLLFCFLHLAAEVELARVLCEKRVKTVAFETVYERDRLPILAPMSEIAGRLATQIGTTLLYRHNGGRGVMLGGLPSAERGHVVILGAGNVGLSAASVAVALGARVTVLCPGRERQIAAHGLGANVTALPAYAEIVTQAVLDADLFVGAVLVPGARAPKAVSREIVKRMRPGSVIVDVSVDQGGCVETTHPTTYDDPTYVVDGVVHFAVTNMPGAVPRTSSQALSSALLPYAIRLAEDPNLNDPILRGAANTVDGKIVHPAVRDAVEGQ